MTRSPDRDEDFRHFVEAHWSPLTRSAYLILGDHGAAEHLVRQALASLHRHWHHVVREGAPLTYVRTAMVGRAVSEDRRSWLWEAVLGRPTAQAAPSNGGAPDDHAPDDPTTHDDPVVQELRRLPLRMRAVVVLRYVDGLEEAATADILGVSVGSVRRLSARGLERLAAAAASERTERTLP
jgi:RNA polymerase sigma-70 factor (sigma-E family)